MSPAQALLLSALAAALAANGQMKDNTEKQLACGEHRGERQARECAMRETTLAATGALDVNSSPNGGITVKGWARPEVLVRARVEAWGDDVARAKEIAGQVRVVAAAGDVHAEGPRDLRHEGWAVSFEIFAPHRTGVTAKTTNGGITLCDLEGTADLRTTNGGMHLQRLAGKVKSTTTNGGVTVELMETAWRGESLDVTTTNGGISVMMPENYNAQIEAATRNGGIHTSLPLTVSGDIHRQISAKAGAGGATLRFQTTNGGVSIRRPGESVAKGRTRHT